MGHDLQQLLFTLACDWMVEVGDFMPVLLQLAQNYTNPDSVNYKLA